MSDSDDMVKSIADFLAKKREAAEVAGGIFLAVNSGITDIKDFEGKFAAISASLTELGTKAAKSSMAPQLTKILTAINDLREQTNVLLEMAKAERDRLSSDPKGR